MVFSAFACPSCHREIAPGGRSGRCSRCGHGWSVSGSVVDFLGAAPVPLTTAQRLNFSPISGKGYELWRRRSLSILTGQHFPLASEIALVADMAPPRGTCVDLACSTALYARRLARASPRAEFLAIDIAPPMLREARRKVEQECLSGRITLARARAQAVPVASGAVDNLYCGGSANETGELDSVLAEVARVLRTGGIALFMVLLHAVTAVGRLAQRIAQRAGAVFFDAAGLRDSARAAGLEMREFAAYGAVGFMTMTRGR